MAYDMEELERQAQKAIDTLPKYKDFDSFIYMKDAESMFSERMESESAFVDSFIYQVKPMIESVYEAKVISVETEKFFNFRKAGLFNFRADIYVRAEENDFLIEAKNPTHTFRESIAGITQLMTYDIALERMDVDVKKIYLSSTIEPMVIEFIKKYNLDIDVFLFNGKQTALWDNRLTN